MYLSRNQLDSAANVLSRVHKTNMEDSAYVELFDLLISLAGDDKTIFDIGAEEEEILRDLQNRYTTSAFYAGVILEIVKGEKHDHELEEFEDGGRYAQQERAKEIIPASGFSIAPNPARNSFTIRTTSINEKQFISVYSTTGILTSRYELAPYENHIEIPCNNLQQGIYCIRLTGIDNNIKEINRVAIIK